MMSCRLFWALLILMLFFIIRPIFAQSEHRQVQRIENALDQYQYMMNDPWPKLKIKKTLKVGDMHDLMPDIRLRLAKLSDLPTQDMHHDNIVYDEALYEAVKQFQNRHGLEAHGDIDKKTIKALNISPKARHAKLLKNKPRWSKIPNGEDSRYVLVNIPDFHLRVYEDNMNVLTLKVVVGKPSWRTPTFSSEVSTIVLNPYWHVPRSIAESEIVHYAARDPSCIHRHSMNLVDKNGQHIDPHSIDWSEYTGKKDLPYRIAQRPGSDNALGKMKFLFPSKYPIYLHDTPHKKYFERTVRGYSHGCIRLKNPHQLLAYLLTVNPDIKLDKKAIKKGYNRRYHLKNKVPIHIAYMTAWVDDDGLIHFRDDIYRKDR